MRKLPRLTGLSQGTPQGSRKANNRSDKDDEYQRDADPELQVIPPAEL